VSGSASESDADSLNADVDALCKPAECKLAVTADMQKDSLTLTCFPSYTIFIAQVA
jgi:hypothetical protein